jgi:hypothetical protein
MNLWIVYIGKIWCDSASNIVGDIASSLCSLATLGDATEIERILIAKESKEGIAISLVHGQTLAYRMSLGPSFQL